jgi:hypothetical protein
VLKIKGNLLFAIFFMILGLAGIIQSLKFQYWEAITLPLALSSVISLGAAIEIIKILSKKPLSTETQLESEVAHPASVTKINPAIALMVWVAVFMLAVWTFGFLIVIPLFAFAYLKWRKRSWFVSISFAIIAVIIVYLVFELALRSELYRGLIFSL